MLLIARIAPDGVAVSSSSMRCAVLTNSTMRLTASWPRPDGCLLSSIPCSRRWRQSARRSLRCAAVSPRRSDLMGRPDGCRAALLP